MRTQVVSAALVAVALPVARTAGRLSPLAFTLALIAVALLLGGSAQVAQGSVRTSNEGLSPSLTCPGDPADLVLSVGSSVGATGVPIGTLVTYFYNVTNGGCTASSVSLTMDAPGGGSVKAMRINGTSASLQSCDQFLSSSEGLRQRCSGVGLGTIETSATSKVELDVEVRLAGRKSASGSVSTSTSESNLANNSASVFTFVDPKVNATDDNNDGNCNTTHCSFREAINASNDGLGFTRIHFGISGTPPFTIAPAGALPTLTDQVEVDGTTQSGFAGEPVIVLNGASAGGGVNGLTVQTTAKIRGLVIQDFSSSGILVSGGFAEIYGNWIGTNAAGTAAAGNGLDGITVKTGGNVIGGSSAGQRNVISGNLRHGIVLSPESASGNVIQGNRIGTDKTGTLDITNASAAPGGGVGVFLEAPSNIVGGGSFDEGNLISGNGIGVFIAGSIGSDGQVRGRTNAIFSNRIGVDVNGAPLGNSFAGVEITGFANGIDLNTIAHNGTGVVVRTLNRNSITRNSIYSNTGLGIDLGADGVTPNDAGDEDAGANDLQNFPVLSSASTTGSSTRVTGTLNSTPDKGFYLEVFSSPACDASGNGEGKTFIGLIGSDEVITDTTGNASFSKTFTLSVPVGTVVTATARNVFNSTSEFSACQQVQAAPTITTVLSGGGVSGSSIVVATGTAVRDQATLSGATSDAGGTVTYTLYPNEPCGTQFTIVSVVTVTNGTVPASDTVVFNSERTFYWVASYSGDAKNEAATSGCSDEVLTVVGPQTFVVNTTNDANDGVCNAEHCSLREAIIASNANLGKDTIVFNIPGAGPHTIQPSENLPSIDDPVTLHATTQPGYSGTPLIFLDGSLIEAGVGIAVLAGNSEIRGLAIGNFPHAGIHLLTGGGNAVIENHLGTDVTGTAARANLHGIVVESGNNVIEGNVVSANTQNGIVLLSGAGTSTVILSNIIGLDASGTAGLGNGSAGIRLTGAGGQIGGTAAAARNVIANNQLGISLSNGGSNHPTFIQGNYIGTDITGTVALWNGVGVTIQSAPGTRVGGSAAGAGNLISGNGIGIHVNQITHPAIDGAYTAVIQGNIVGLNAAGTGALGNSTGIEISSVTGDGPTLIGGLGVGEGNVVSGNAQVGIRITGALGSVVRGNYVGTNAAGTAAIGNLAEGILLTHAVGPPATLISGNLLVGNAVGVRFFNVAEAAVTGNVISGNSCWGAYLGSTSTVGLNSNKIGVLADGTTPLGNGCGGVILIHDYGTTQSQSNALVSNVIAFNDSEGVHITNGSSNNVLFNNTIRQNEAVGVLVVGETTNGNQIEAGSITGHAGSAIDLVSFANDGITPPVMTDVLIGGASGLTVSGTAIPGGFVSIYVDPDDEAQTFLGDVVAGPDGSWTKSAGWTLADLSAITTSLNTGALKLHATQRDSAGNTSELSAGAGPSGIVVVARCSSAGPVLAGITAQLVQDGVVLATTITTAEGLALFPTAVAGTYSVVLLNEDGSARCVITVTIEGDGDQIVDDPAPCTTANTTWLTAADLTVALNPPPDREPTTGVLCLGGHLWYRIVMPGGGAIVPQLSRIVARLTGVGGGQLPGDYTLMLVKDPMLALQPVQSATDAHVQFAGDTFGGDTFGGDTFGGDTFGGDTFGGDTFGGDTFGGDTFGGDTFGGDTFGGDTFGGDTFGGDTFGGDTFGGDTFGGDTFGGDTFGGDTFGGDTFGDIFTLAGGDPRAYAAAISRSVVRVAAHRGTSPEGLWQNTWNNAITWYLRVSSVSGSGPFEVSAQVFTGQCGVVDPTVGASTLTVPSSGTYHTLILRNSAREGGADALANGTSLQALARDSTVNGYIADFASDTGLAAAYAQLDANAFCPNAANTVAERIRAYVRAFRDAHPELRWIVVAANDEGVPGYRVPDLSTLAPQSMLVLPLQPEMVEGELRLNYFATDDAYGDWDPVQKLDHLLFIPEIPVGRIDPEYVPTIIDAYLAANGVITPSTAAVTGYNFWNDSATSIRDQLAATGKAVNAFQTTNPLIQDGQGLPTDAFAWDVNDLVDAFEADTDVFVLFAHGLRASRIAPANYFPELTAQQAIAIGDANPQIKRLKLLISGACNFALGVPAGQTIPGTTPDPELAEIGQAFGWATVAWDTYAYGDDERMGYSEELADDLIRELRYGDPGEDVVLGDALVRVKKAWAARQTDLQGIHQKSLMGMVILGLPMMRIDLGETGRLTRPSDLADFASTDLAAVPAETAGSNAAVGLRTKDITIDFTDPAHKLTRVDVPLENVDATGTSLDTTTTASYWAVTTPTAPQGFVQLNPGEQILPRWSVPLHPNDLAGDSATFARGATLVSASCTRTTPFTPLISRAAYQLTPPAGPFITDRYLPNDWWEINYLDPTREFLLVRPAQYLSAINATTGVPEVFGTSKTFTNVTFRAWYSSLLTQTITDANGEQMQAILAGPPEFLARTATPSADGTAIDFDVRVSVLPNLGVQSVTVLWQDTDANAECAIRSFELTQDTTNGQRWYGTLDLTPFDASASTVSYSLQAVSGAGRVRVADNFGLWYPAQAAPTLTAPLADTALAFLSPPASAVSGRTLTVSAELRRSDTSTPVSGRRLLFRLSGVNGDRAFGYTNANGVAQATLDVDALPGALSVWVEFEGDEGLRGSSQSSALTVQKETTAFSLLTVAPSTQQDTDVIQVSARLADGLGRRLREQGVLFLVTSAACAAYLATDPVCVVIQAQGAETDFRGDARASFALATGAGAFRVHALFAGTAAVPSGLASPLTITLDLQNARYQPATAGSAVTVTAEDVTVAYTGDSVKATGEAISLSGTLTEAADGSVGTTLGGILASFEIRDGSGVLVATVFGAVAPTGPGTATATGSLPAGLATGVYSIVLTVSGDRIGQSPVVLIAVYDPSGGFVTGGGWIDSPAGACQLNAVCAGATGRAAFGFVSKYQKGATTPTGQTQFQFKAGGLNFHSSSYDWLVVAGARAQYKGSGTINGSGDYGFMLTAIDGQVSGGGGSDKFRIKIWDKATGAVVYDNQAGGADDAEPTTVIKGGSIVIHR